MKQLMRCVVLSGAAVLTACASPAPAPAARTATRPQSIAEGAAAAWQSESKLRNGERRIVVNGQERLCRTFLATGSRAEKTVVCLTPAQWEAQEASSQAFMQGVQRSGAIGVRPYILSGLAPPPP